MVILLRALEAWPRDLSYLALNPAVAPRILVWRPPTEYNGIHRRLTVTGSQFRNVINSRAQTVNM